MRARMIDRDLGALAGEEVGDMHANSFREPHAMAGLVERRRRNLALIHAGEPSALC